METMTAQDANARHPTGPPARPRTAHGATFVALLYVALVLAAPAIVRYFPAGDARAVAATPTPHHIQCAWSADEPGGCPAQPVARVPHARAARKRTSNA